MIFKSLTARAMLGAGVLSLVGGGAAAASSGILPMAAAATQASPAPARPAPSSRAQRDIVRGVVQSVSDKRDSIVVETRHRDASTRAVVKDDVTIFLTNTTRVVRWDDRGHQLGLDAIKAGERVRVRYVVRDGNKYAARVVILPEVRAGKVDSKGSGQFTITTRAGQTLVVSVTSSTKYFDVVSRHDRKPGSFAAMNLGDRVVVLGKLDANGTFDAAVVAYRQPAR